MQAVLSRLIIVGLLLMLFALVSIAQGSRDSTASNSSAPRCLGNQLSLREAEGEADIGGKQFGNYVFTNISSSPCTLQGYPRFALLNRYGRTMRGVKVSYEEGFVSGDSGEARSSDAPQLVTIEPGKTAWFQIFYNTGMAMEDRGPFPISAKVRITAPGTNRVFVLRGRIQACCGVQVSSVRGGLPQ